ncbi:MAG: hypothetical protein IKS45_12590 [Thermoguttaceae bacterium]|nr:hypothetical protein [Thermoguttaceae bacterium]
MSDSLRRSFFPSLYSFIAVGYFISMGWSAIRPERPEMPPAFARWVDGAVPSILDNINENKGDVCVVAVSHFANDPTAYVSEAIRLEASKKTYVMDKSMLEKVYDWLNLPLDSKPEILTQERATQLGKYAKSVNAQAVIWGSVIRMNNLHNRVDAEIKYYLIGQDGSILYDSVCNNASLEKSNIADTAVTTLDKFQSIDWRTRLLLWALAVITFPLLTINFLIATTAKRSNKSNAFALILYTLIDGIALYLMVPPNFKEMEFYSILFFVCMILAAGFCNLMIMNFALKFNDK